MIIRGFAKIAIAFMLLLPCIYAGAQTIATDSLFIRLLNSDKLLPALIDSAIKNNPEVNRVDNSIGLAKENLAITKKNIYNAVSLFSSYNYGTNANVTTGQLSSISLSQSSFYNVGVYLQLPLTHIVSRKNTIRASEFQVKMAESEKEGAAQYISQEVIREYQELKLAQKLVKIASDGKQAALLNYQMCQKQFLQNDLPVAELSRIQDIYNKAAIEFETDVNRFETAYLQLENYTGVKLSNIIRAFE